MRDKNTDREFIGSITSTAATNTAARRAAKKAGLPISKFRERRNVNQLGGYQLTDSRNIVVNEANFELTAAVVIAFCEQHMEEASHLVPRLGER
jgi:hypothetical protein